MPRRPRNTPAGYAYHVLNRSVGKFKLFRHDADFDAFGRVLLAAWEREPIGILSYCVMPTHWHFVVLPKDDAQVTRFFRWLAHTHAMRWRAAHNTVGYGHLYQGRFKSFPIQKDDHLLSVCRYVERNALSAGLVRRAQDWKYSSLWTRSRGDAATRKTLCDWPVDRPRDWTALVNQPLTRRELERLDVSLKRGRPFGEEAWIAQCARKLNLEHTIRREGRPEKRKDAANSEN